MSPEHRSDQHGDGAAENLSPAYSDNDFKELQKKLAELRDQSILIGGDGPRETLRPVARVPGGLKRFLAERE
jgi:hypothetical protein